MFETAKEVALRLGVTVRAVKKWAKQGEFNGTVLQGKRWIKLRDVRDWTSCEKKKDNAKRDFIRKCNAKRAYRNRHALKLCFGRLHISV